MKDITSLREKLFDQLNKLSDASNEDLDTEVKRAASVVQVSETIIKSAEVENTFIAITKGIGSGFIPLADIGKKGLINLVTEKIHKQEQDEHGDSEGEEDETVVYGNRTISKKTLGDHKSNSTIKDNH